MESKRLDVFVHPDYWRIYSSGGPTRDAYEDALVEAARTAESAILLSCPKVGTGSSPAVKDALKRPDISEFYTKPGQGIVYEETYTDLLYEIERFGQIVIHGCYAEACVSAFIEQFRTSRPQMTVGKVLSRYPGERILQGEKDCAWWMRSNRHDWMPELEELCGAETAVYPI